GNHGWQGLVLPADLVFDHHVLPIDKTSRPQTLVERGYIGRRFARGSVYPYEADDGGALLRPRRERPCRRAAEERDDLAAFHSITSSARSRIDGGTARPSAFAVLRFTTISNFVGNCTGRSPGFSPRRMRST